MNNRRRCHLRPARQSKRLIGKRLTIGVSTIWLGQSILLWIATLASHVSNLVHSPPQWHPLPHQQPRTAQKPCTPIRHGLLCSRWMMAWWLWLFVSFALIAVAESTTPTELNLFTYHLFISTLPFFVHHFLLQCILHTGPTSSHPRSMHAAWRHFSKRLWCSPAAISFHQKCTWMKPPSIYTPLETSLNRGIFGQPILNLKANVTYLFTLTLFLLRITSCTRSFCCRHHTPFNIVLAYCYESATNAPTTCHFDTDSFQIGVDNHASHCMANSPTLFNELALSPNKLDRKVNGIGTELNIAGQGTFVIGIKDNDGGIHTICIKNSIYYPDMRLCLLFPQHWAQEAEDNYSLLNGTWMENFANNCVLIWKQAKYCKTIPFNLTTNMPIFCFALSMKSYRAFVADC